jgi:cysteine synthase A
MTRRCRWSYDLLTDEGLCLGGSSGINICRRDADGARDGAGAHHRDDPVRLRHRYQSKLFNPALDGFLRRDGMKGLPVPRGW